MALQNALYTGDLARLLELFPPHSTADLLLECRAAEPRWSSQQRGEDGVGGLGWPHRAQRYPELEEEEQPLAVSPSPQSLPKPWPRSEVMRSPE